MSLEDKTYKKFVNDFGSILKNKLEDLEISKLIFLCIGTDRIIGDSFGPVVGYKLKSLFSENDNIDVIGDLENNVNLSNIESIISNIYNTYETPFVIAIDSAVSNKKEIGSIVVSKLKMNVAGMDLNKKIYIGDVSIKGITSIDLQNTGYNFRLLQNVPLSLIVNMADIVSQGIYKVVNII